MRTKIITTMADGRQTESYKAHGDLPQDLAEMLAVVNLASVTLKFTDGMTSEYHHLEYDCEWCGSYDGHSIEECPSFQEGDEASTQG